MTPVEITNELALSDHGGTPDNTFIEEVIDDGIHTVSDDTDPYQDETFKEIPISDGGASEPKDESDNYSQEEFETAESPSKFNNSRVQNNVDFNNTFAKTLEAKEEIKDEVEDNMSSPERTPFKKVNIMSPGSLDEGFNSTQSTKAGQSQSIDQSMIN